MPRELNSSSVVGGRAWTQVWTPVPEARQRRHAPLHMAGARVRWTLSYMGRLYDALCQLRSQLLQAVEKSHFKRLAIGERPWSSLKVMESGAIKKQHFTIYWFSVAQLVTILYCFWHITTLQRTWPSEVIVETSFYRATLCYSAVYAIAMSVCPSQVGILLNS